MFPVLASPECTSVCQTHSEPGADVNGIVASITERTTIAEFDARISGASGYALNQGATAPGDHALCRAAYVGNTHLVRHIVGLGGKDLLNLGNTRGHTPLLLAIRKSHLETAEELLRLGANPNIGWQAVKGSPNALILSPLWEALVTTKNDKMQELLMRYGARIDQTALQTTAPKLVTPLIERDDRLKCEEDALAAVDALAKMPRELIHLANQYAS